jgi:secreted trypsin-like serine protease
MNFVNRKVATLSWAVSALAVLSACGQSPQTLSNGAVSVETAIVGGKEADGTEVFAKHVVGLYDAKIGAICTASILSETILVTAAHCVDSEASALRVVFGTDFNSKDIIVQPVDAYQISPIYAFRQGQEFNTGDIALVKFSGGLPAGYTPVHFLTDATKLATDMDVVLAGYGASTVVQKPDPKTGALVAEHENAGKLRFVTTTMKNAQYSKSEFLTEASKGKGACHGDSGGPAYVEIDGELVLTGVTSRTVGDEQDMCNVSAAYTSIPFYANWIVSTSKQLNALVPASKPATATTVAHR